MRYQRGFHLQGLGQCGFGMVELMIAVLLFSLGLAGAHAAALVARQTGAAALGHTQASAHAREILARIGNNSGAVDAYVEAALQWGGHRPGQDYHDDTNAAGPNCNVEECSPTELAQYDVLQWHAAMLGASIVRSDAWAAPLPDARACIARKGATIEVRVSWSVAGLQSHRAEPGCLESNEGAENASARAQVLLAALVGP